jgi:hypothetical protein
MQLDPNALRVGRFVQLSLRTGDKCEGFIFCFSPQADLLVLGKIDPRCHSKTPVVSPAFYI